MCIRDSHQERKVEKVFHPIEQQRIQPVRTGRTGGAEGGGKTVFSLKKVKTSTGTCRFPDF
jgi:hypothetical protein